MVVSSLYPPPRRRTPPSRLISTSGKQPLLASDQDVINPMAPLGSHHNPIPNLGSVRLPVTVTICGAVRAIPVAMSVVVMALTLSGRQLPLELAEPDILANHIVRLVLVRCSGLRPGVGGRYLQSRLA